MVVVVVHQMSSLRGDDRCRAADAAAAPNDNGQRNAEREDRADDNDGDDPRSQLLSNCSRIREVVRECVSGREGRGRRTVVDKEGENKSNQKTKGKRDAIKLRNSSGNDRLEENSRGGKMKKKKKTLKLTVAAAFGADSEVPTLPRQILDRKAARCRHEGRKGPDKSRSVAV